MISRPVAVGLLAAGCFTAAAGGSYWAVRENAAAAAKPAAVAPAAAPSSAAPSQPVTETETIVDPADQQVEPDAAPPAAPRRAVPAPLRRTPPPVQRSEPALARASAPPLVSETPAPPAAEQPAEAPLVERAADHTPAPSVEPAVAEPPPAEVPATPRFEELVVPVSSVIGLEVETSISSERARIEDRVDARVTRDVFADGRLAIPAGSRVIGSVTFVDRGGKVKERARLGVRFHTLVLADGRQVDMRTDTVFREGESPSAESSRKIGGAAVGGAVLGAIMGGGKGAILGGAAGAAGGTAAVMAGERNAATLANGTIVNARLASPIVIEVERR